MSWWDYGYQIAGMANRTTLVDNNTWNNSHIALVRTSSCSCSCSILLRLTGTLFVPRFIWFLAGVAASAS